MPTSASVTSKTVLHAIHNLPKKVKGRARSVTHSGKENGRGPRSQPYKPPPVYRPRINARAALIASESFTGTRWAPKDGIIIVKVSVPCMDDIWRFKVAEGVTLERLTRRAEGKIGFPVTFSYAHRGSDRERAVRTEDAFREWIETRVQKGINTPLIARVRV
ncbi:hypothetical protein FOMPIDRAFT_1165952 [Fomitopsis schrenkii]|uniref:Uncharacterized protein n=1 Tax=Fomitopsis schrenkii TaxID=2126942 RepID=S8DZQ8_FOMSC|nr:hypothetical protein FOMPIDRAFT_1165952 [Fomitopsis schrenkii]